MASSVGLGDHARLDENNVVRPITLYKMGASIGLGDHIQVDETDVANITTLYKMES